MRAVVCTLKSLFFLTLAKNRINASSASRMESKFGYQIMRHCFSAPVLIAQKFFHGRKISNGLPNKPTLVISTRYFLELIQIELRQIINMRQDSFAIIVQEELCAKMNLILA